MDELTRILATAAATGIISAIGSAAVLAFLGPKATADYTRKQAEKDAGAARLRIIAAIKADMELAEKIARHNVRSADTPGNDRPRAFIPLHFHRYQELLFQGADLKLVDPVVLEALLEYLAQVQHANAMISLFEHLEVQTSAIAGAPLSGKKSQYVQQIGNYCRDEIPPLLTRLRKALDQASI
jgi:hypothetical protein